MANLEQFLFCKIILKSVIELTKIMANFIPSHFPSYFPFNNTNKKIKECYHISVTSSELFYNDGFLKIRLRVVTDKYESVYCVPSTLLTHIVNNPLSQVLAGLSWACGIISWILKITWSVSRPDQVQTVVGWCLVTLMAILKCYHSDNSSGISGH